MADSDYVVEFLQDYAVLRMKNIENRFNMSSVSHLRKALDQVESNEDVKFLITTGEGKFFSNGLDLNKLVHYSNTELEQFLAGMYSLYTQVLTFPMPTIAAVNGHCYAAGGIFALLHDYRIMRTKQGWFCLPEINLQLRFSSFLNSLLNAKILDARVKTDAVIMGRKYTAEDALEAKLVDKICDESELLDTAIEFGRNVVGNNNWNRKHMANLKRDLYRNVFEEPKQEEIDRRREAFSKL